MFVAQWKHVVAIPIAGVMAVLYYFGLLFKIREGLSHVITFSTVLLTVVGVVYSVITVVQTKETYKSLQETHDKALKELHNIMHDSVLYCIIVVLISIMILLIKLPDNLYIKIPIALIGSYLFTEMVVTCTASFLMTMFLFQASDKD